MERPEAIDKEVIWDKSRTIMSKTDTAGIIEYANDVFIDVSGYEEYELMGQPHSIIRHPDMPQVVFKVLWDRIEQGDNIHAVVKNLAKSGRYYWVITDFTVNYNKDGEIESYTAHRKACPDAIVAKVEKLYKKLLQIEQVAGLEGSEKYLKGYLEDMGKTYDEYIEDIINSDKGSRKSWFSRFFGR